MFNFNKSAILFGTPGRICSTHPRGLNFTRVILCKMLQIWKPLRLFGTLGSRVKDFLKLLGIKYYNMSSTKPMEKNLIIAKGYFIRLLTV